MDPFSLVVGTLTLVQLCIKSGALLHDAINSIKTNHREVTHLLGEIKALIDVLQALERNVKADADTFEPLNFMLAQCTHACDKLNKAIAKAFGDTKQQAEGIRVWIRLKQRGSDIETFKKLIDSYKATLTIALADANLRTSRVTKGLLEEYTKLSKTATANLEERIEELSVKLEFLKAEKSSTMTEGIRLTEENQALDQKNSLEQCMSICLNLINHIQAVRPTIHLDSREVINSVMKDTNMSVPRMTNNALDVCTQSLGTTVQHLRDIADEDRSKEEADEAELIQHLGGARRCLEILKKSEQDRVNIFEKIDQSEDSRGNDAFITQGSLLELGLPKLRIWLKINHVDHASSSIDITKIRLPTRLLDISGSAANSIKLWQTSPGDVGEWVTLSYSWDKRSSFRTTLENYQHRLNTIRIDELPNDFRDAITLTRTLGFRNLWIDTLCIIQDSQEDWFAESSRMAEVYSGAVLNIVAIECPIEIQSTTGAIEFKHGDVPLDTGGWVIQERMLSPRTLYFTKPRRYLSSEDAGWERSHSSYQMEFAPGSSVPAAIFNHQEIQRMIGFDEQNLKSFDEFEMASTCQGSTNIRFSSFDTSFTAEGTTLWRCPNTPGYLKDIEVYDINSDMTTPDEQEAKDYIANFLAVETELNILCRALLSTMDESSLIQFTQQALETFYDGLLEDATTELEQKSVNLLRSYRGRARISRRIIYIVNAQSNQDKEDRKKAEEQNRLRALRLERFAAEHHHLTHEVGEYANFEQDDGSFDRGTNDDEEGELPNITEMKRFFGNSESFQVLLNRFRLLLLPQELRSIVQSIPADNIRLSGEEERSFINHFKAVVENYTLLDWNWWPLQPCMRSLKVDETRLIWYCSCGMRLWKEIGLDEARLIRLMLSTKRSECLEPTQCIPKQQISPLWMRLLEKVTYALSAMNIEQQKTPANDTGSITSTGTRVMVNGNAQLTNNILEPRQQHGLSSPTPSHTCAPTSNDPCPPKWILFGVQGARLSMELEHIEINDYVNDSSFYRSLRTHYRKHRGKLRLWFSIWRLGFCDGVKFDRMAPDFVLGDDTDLPTDFSEYQYEPKPPAAKNPLIGHHQASMFLNCDNPCRWRIFHECVPELIGRKTIERIPQKRSKFDIKNIQPSESEAWGLKAKYQVSAAYVAVYHMIILVAPFIFWGWWQSIHPNDMQNASVPATVAIGLLSLFWSANGILTQGRLGRGGA